MPGFKASEEKKTVLLGDNVVGHKLEPVTWPSENPRAFQHINKNLLPVSYRNDAASFPRCPLE